MYHFNFLHYKPNPPALGGELEGCSIRCIYRIPQNPINTSNHKSKIIKMEEALKERKKEFLSMSNQEQEEYIEKCQECIKIMEMCLVSQIDPGSLKLYKETSFLLKEHLKLVQSFRLTSKD